MPKTTIVIPVQQYSKMLEGCIKQIEQTTNDYDLQVICRPDLNVSEARQLAMETVQSEYICFLDDDSRMYQKGWLQEMITSFDKSPNIAIAFAEEVWGDCGVLQKYDGVQPVEYGPAACMLIKKDRLPASVVWNKYIGLSTGWLGGDFEEVELAHDIQHKGQILVGVEGARFKHIDRPSKEEFLKTDRYKTCYIMQALIRHWSRLCPDNKDFFKSLNYVKADPNNDRMLAGGETLRKCFYGVLKDNNLLHFPMFKRWGLT